MQYETLITDTHIKLIWIWTAMSIPVITVNWFCRYRNRKTVKNALQTLYRTGTYCCWMRDAMLDRNRGVYDYWKCLVIGSCSISQVGEDNTELRPKKLRKMKFINVIKQLTDRVSLGKSKFGANFGVALHCCMGFWSLFLSKLGGQIFQNIRTPLNTTPRPICR
mgnify:FL=1